MKKIEIEIPDGKRAEWVDGVLTLVDEKPKDVAERIKTFEDALNELGMTHPFVKSYVSYKVISFRDDLRLDYDILAYLKLRIICAALNEGWEPKYTKDERRYYPRFLLYIKTEFENMSEEMKKEPVKIDTNGYDTEYAGLVFSYSDCVPSYTFATFDSRLCLKNSDLAKYCGKQFINIWADYLLRRK